MIRIIVLDFFNVILLPQHMPDVEESLLSDPTGLCRVNTELLEKFRKIQEEKNIPVCIFTASSPQEYGWLAQELDWVKNIYTSTKMGLSKGDVDSYTELAEHMGAIQTEILFIDDNLSNISAAKKAGWQTIQYKNKNDLFMRLEPLLS
jgi:HAD superfamily hydrolase (TIGR01509 family)